MQVQYDEPTTEWFKKHPERVIGFCLCHTCGLGYDESIAPHKCPGKYTGANKELLKKMGIEIPEQEGFMEKRSVYDIFAGDFVEMPPEMAAFLADVEAVCRKHGFSISHEDNQGGFRVELLQEDNLDWLTGAAKQYTRELDPATGAVLAPARMGRECPARGESCRACQFKDYCFNPYDKRAAAQLKEILKED